MCNYSWAPTLDTLGTRASLYPQREIAEDVASGTSYTYAELNKHANALANYFKEELELKPGERIALISRNSIECLVCFFAVQKAGLVLVPLNWRLSVREVLEQLNQTEPLVLFYDAQFASQVEEITGEYSFKEIVYWVENGQPAGQCSGSYLGNIYDQASLIYRSYPKIDYDDPLMILFTGGTTGPPKGAVLSHRTVFFNMLSEALCWGLGPGQSIPVLLPFFHTGGWNLLTLPSIFAGAKVFILRGFDPEKTLQLVEQEKCRTIFAAPTMFQILSAHENWQKTDLSSLEWVMSGAAPCSRQIMEPYWERGIPFVQGYGITEGGPNNLFVPWYELTWNDLKEKWSSVGKPFLYCFARLVDDEGHEVNSGEEGELLLSGPVTFSGYWKRPRETAQTLHEGWVHTGDIARQDEDGFFYIVDRKKDMFISGGENVFPVEVENAIVEHPAIKDAAVIGVAHPKWGEVGKAFVIPREKSEVSEEELNDFLRQRLAKYKIPAHIKFVDHIPKSPVGKVLKKDLKDK